MERKGYDPPNIVEDVRPGHYDAKGFLIKFPGYNSYEITQEDIDNKEWRRSDGFQLITLADDEKPRLHKDGAKINGWKKFINNQSAGRKKKRKRKTKRRKSKRRKGKRKRRRKTRKRKRRSKIK